MINGSAKQELTWNDICRATNNGYDVYRSEIGNFPINKTFRSPLRSKDTHPSFGIAPRDGIWLHKDLSTGVSGNCVQFVQQKYGITFKEAMYRIAIEFGIIKGETKQVKHVLIDWKPPVFEEKETIISFSSCKFDNAHSSYFDAYHLSEDFLRSNNVYRVRDWAVNRRRIAKKDRELTFAYYAEDIDRVKILRIGVKREDKWRTNVPGDYLWYADKIDEKCPRLVISKSCKDALVLRMLGICSLASQSENISCIEPNVDKLKQLGKSIYINFGSDKQGKEQSLKITERFGYKHYNIPDEYLELGINDSAELCKYDMGLLKEHLKQKGFL